NEDGSVRTRCGECGRCNTLVNAREVGDFDLIIVDECFPAGTTVGGRPIEDLQKGDLVPSWNEKTGRTEYRRVAAVMRKVPQAMVKVSFNDREDLVCTPNHPILTEDGWCPAGMLRRGASVVSFTHDTGTAAGSTLYGMLDVGADQGQEAEEPVQEERKGLLHAGVQGCMGEEGPVAEDVGDEPEVRIGEDAEEELHARAGVCSEDEGHSGENGTSPRIQGRERKARYDAAAVSGEPSRKAYRSSDSGGRSGTSEPHTSGYSASDHVSGSGGGWGIPLLQGAPSLRPAEGQKVVLSRVVGVQVLEPGSDGTYGGLCPDGAVYNIEVDGTHTYLIDDGLVVHNCHHAASLSYRRVLRHFGAWSGVPVAGFTATMTRQQGGLDKVWHDVAYRREIAEMIRDGYLVAPKGKQVVVKDMDLSKAKVTAGDFTTKSLSDLMLDSSAMTDIASAYKEHASDRPGIVFCPTVAVAHEMAEAFKAEGITAATVWGAMTNDERRHTLSRFSSGEVQVLVNCMVLTEGFDEPKASCLVVARPTKNHGLYIQMVGRVLRLSPETGKTDALILDVTGATTRHKLVSVSDLTGKKKGVKGTKHGEADDEPDGTEIKPETEAGVQMEKELLAIGGWRDVDLMSASSGARWLRSPKGYR